MIRRGILGLSAALFLAGCAVAPVPLTEADLDAAANDRLARVDAEQEPVSEAIGLYEAMARALKYNLDHRVEMMQIALAQKELGSASLKMLPQLVANSGYAGRNNTAASYSRSLFSGIVSAEPSTSAANPGSTADLTFTWHVLDFGLSYARAKQSADKVMIAEEQKRRIINRIIEDVRTAYWRAISAERLLGGLQRLEGRVAKAQANARAIRNSGQTSPLAALTYERELIGIKRQILRLEREMSASRFQLAALMNVRPDTEFRLVVPKRSLTELRISMSGSEMAEMALRNRPEFRDLLYKERINKRELDVALLEMLPGISIDSALSIDSNDFLYNNNWASWGIKASWNAMRLFQYPARKAEVGAQGKLIDEQSRAMTMAIMTQVHVARARYGYMLKSAETAAEYSRVQREILGQMQASVAANAAGQQTLVREEMNTLVAAAEYDLAYADLQNAFAAIYATIGVDPHPADIDLTQPVDVLAATLRGIWRERGERDG